MTSSRGEEIIGSIFNIALVDTISDDINVNFQNYHLGLVNKPRHKCIFFRYGPSSKTFTLEAGRRAQSGEGYFIFKTKEADIIYQHVTDIKDAMKSKMKIDQGRGTEATMFIA